MTSDKLTLDNLTSKAQTSIPNYDPKILYKLLYLIIVKVTSEYKYNKVDNAPINANKYFSPISKQYKLYLDFLIDQNIIKNSGGYMPNHYSKSFSINPNYLETPILEIILESGWVNYNFLNDSNSVFNVDFFDDNFSNVQNNKYYHIDLYDFLFVNFVQIRFDYNAALTKLNEIQFELENTSNTEIDNYYQYLYHFMSIKNLHNRKISFLIDSYGRLHTNLTNLPKEYRKFISFNNKSLVSIDVASCQPYLLLLLCNIKFWESFLNIHNSEINTLVSFSQLNFNINITDEDKTNLTELLNTIELQDDYIKFKKITLEGELYQKMGELMFGFSTPIDSVQKSKVKDSMYLVLFSNNKYHTKYKKIFKNTFPSIYKICHIIKNLDHTQLACFLQRLESHIILNLIGNRIRTESNPVPTLTIHDSVITTADNVDFLESIMNDELTKAVGFTPVLKIEPWY